MPKILNFVKKITIILNYSLHSLVTTESAEARSRVCGEVLVAPQKPLVAIVGGAKISDKVPGKPAATQGTAQAADSLHASDPG